MLKKFLPRISETERVALECGTVSADGDIFKGNKPNVELVNFTHLQSNERQFLENEVEDLINLQRKHGYLNNDLHPLVWQFLEQNKFFGLNISKEFGGLGFSPLAQSLVVSRISSSGYIALAVTVMVPNSLGPGELLQHHGTFEEKKEYLPKLASGELLPCFALTGPNNGSDATNNMDKGTLNGNIVTAKLDKRYITLAPAADLIGLAIDVEGHGITLFLVNRDHPGLEIGMRHDPLGIMFLNGPIRGTIELDIDRHVLGGPSNLGRGWQMLVECLSVGRAISLPALATAGSALSAITAGGYAAARKQFNIPIAKLEGVQEALAEIAYQNYVTYVTQMAVNNELQNGEQPAVIGAMWKYQSTERGRKAVNAAMDVLGGSGIQLGPNNIIGELYTAMPIGITVEGANILSRTLITFGQGLMRSHPHVKNIVDGKLSSIGNLVGHATTSKLKALVGNRYALFAWTADMCLTLGSKYKKAGYLSGAMADIFAIRFMEAAIDKMPNCPLKIYSLKRLANEEMQAYRKVRSYLPFYVRPVLSLGMLTALKSEKVITAKDNKAATLSITTKSPWVDEMLSYIHVGGKLENIIDYSYNNKDIDIDIITKVDDK